MVYEIFVNPAAVGTVEPEPQSGPDPIEFHRLMPEYAETPLLDCTGIARELGVARVLVKDESIRLGLPSFKMLGASWAVASAVQRAWLGGTVRMLTPDALRRAVPQPETRRLAAATDGNHGRGVARMARLLGLACTIFVPSGMAAARIADIEGEGAEVRIVDGSYDDAILASAREADERTLVISDTSWEGYTQIPRSVTRGYSTLFREVDDALGRAGAMRPTVVALQAGVGSFAAAGIAHYRGRGGELGVPRTVIVEPRTANCLMASARAGALTAVSGPHLSTMAGLNCGLGSRLAWPTVQQGADVFVAMDDGEAGDAMRLLADSGLVSGESGAAGLGGLLAIARTGTPDERAAVGLDADAVILVVNTEGATDPVNYARVVGRDPHAVDAERYRRRADTGVVAL